MYVSTKAGIFVDVQLILSCVIHERSLAGFLDHRRIHRNNVEVRLGLQFGASRWRLIAALELYMNIAWYLTGLPSNDPITQTVQWYADALFIVNVAELEHAARGDFAGTWRRAVELYRGELLPGCYDERIGIKVCVRFAAL